MLISIIRKAGEDVRVGGRGAAGCSGNHIASPPGKGRPVSCLPACLFCASLGKSASVITSNSAGVNKRFYDDEITGPSSRKENEGFSLKIRDDL